MSKGLISAQTVREAHGQGHTLMTAGKDVLITPEARDLAAHLGIRFEAPPPAGCPASAERQEDPLAAIRAAVIAQLPPDAAAQPDLVEQIVARVQTAARSPAPAPAASPAAPPAGRVKLVKGAEVKLGLFPGAGADKQVGIADVITGADGAPMAAGFMAWSKCFFPWSLDYDEIDLVLDGELHIRCDGSTWVGRSGDVLFIPKGSSIEFGTPTAVRFFYVTWPANWQKPAGPEASA